ncbi:hypothetical protein MRS44_013256 [Fusarium solani]|uniref:uncharacterized protein n=1 Tax=Fusarium solani TaxID=169388 RepID=UPI0032C3E589|nr:hypothetical protein MRS44_013256 [Fusarium solani]
MDIPAGHGTSDGSRRGDLGTSGPVSEAQPYRRDFRPEYQFSQFCRLANTPWYRLSDYEFDGQDEEDDDGDDCDDKSDNEKSNEDDGLVEEFMQNPLSFSQSEDQVTLLLSFCPEKTRQELEHGSLAALSEKVCLFDDRSSDGTRWQTRTCLRPLTVLELWSELSKERFIPDDPPLISSNSDAGNNHPSNTQQRISADRRLIFVTNLNRWGVMALITTASRIEADALRGSLYRHLSFQTYIGVCLNASMGFPFLRFAFDLPFFVWRATRPSQKPYDVRENRHGQSLRAIKDLSFLKRQESTTNDSAGIDSVEVDYLCQAHISIVISIIDNRRWTAYGFIDTYFRTNSEDSVEAYCSDQCNGPIKPDPLTKGSRDADKPVLDPRAYAWAVMEARIGQVNGEWQSVINTCPSNTASFSSIVSQQCLTWIGATRKLLSDLTETIKPLIREWDSFDGTEFFPLDDVILTRIRFRIQGSFRELGKCLDKLESLQRRCECYADNIDLYMSGAGHQDARRQTETTQSMHSLTNVMLYDH